MHLSGTFCRAQFLKFGGKTQSQSLLLFFRVVKSCLRLFKWAGRFYTHRKKGISLSISYEGFFSSKGDMNFCEFLRNGKSTMLNL